MENAAIVGVK